MINNNNNNIGNNNKNKKQLTFLPVQPLLVCAPMVDQSQLPFRMLCRKYGSNLCYTPMLHSKIMTTQKGYKQQHFTTCKQDRPLVAQLCGNDPQTMVKAARMLQKQCDAIDINFGCPQGIAKRGHYGSYLLEQPDLVYQIVKTLTSANLSIPIFCKIRILKTQQKTFNIVNKLIEAGCSLLTIHGRTKQQNKQRVGECDWKIINKIKQSINIPVIANGGIYTYNDVTKCLQQTNVDGVMSAQALLQNPALFSGQIHDLDSIALEYLQMTKKYKGASNSCIRAHLFKILYKGLSQHTDLREKLAKCNAQQFQQIVLQLKERRKNVKKEDKLGWYFRHWKNTEVVKQGSKVVQIIKNQENKEQNKVENKQQGIVNGNNNNNNNENNNNNNNDNNKTQAVAQETHMKNQ